MEKTGNFNLFLEALVFWFNWPSQNFLQTFIQQQFLLIENWRVAKLLNTKYLLRGLIYKLQGKIVCFLILSIYSLSDTSDVLFGPILCASINVYEAAE